MKAFRLSLLVALCLGAIQSHAQIPRIISYQGLLTDTLGNPRPDGVVTFTFRLYEAGTGGSPVWTEVKDLTVQRGLFWTYLGDVIPFGAGVRFDRPYWLGIEPAGEAELSPRVRLSAVGYSVSAIRADTAAHALSSPVQAVVDSARIAGTIPNSTVGTAKLLDGAVTSAKILDGSIQRVDVATTFKAPYADTADAARASAPTGSAGGDLTGSYPNPAIASNAVTTSKVADNAVTGAKILDGTIGTVDMADGAVTSSKIADGTVATVDLADGAVTMSKLNPSGAATGQVIKWSGTAWIPATDSSGGPPTGVAGGALTGTYPSPDIASNAVTTAKIADSSVTTTKLASNAVVSSKIAPAQVVKSVNGLRDHVVLSAQGGATVTTSGDTIVINAGSGGAGTGVQGIQNTNSTLDVINPGGPTVTVNVKALGIASGHLADAAISTAKLQDGAVTQSKIAAGVTLPPGGTAGGDLAGTFPSPTIASGAVSATKLADNSVASAKLQDGAVTQTKIAPGVTLPPSGAAGGDLTGTYPNPTIGSGTIGTTKLADNSVTGTKILDGTIGTADIADGAVTSAKIADGTIATMDIADNAVATAKIADAAVTLSKLNASGASSGQVMMSNGSSVVWGSITTYSAGTGLQLSGSTFSLADSGVTSAKLRSDAASLNKVSGGLMSIASGRVGIGMSNPFSPFVIQGVTNWGVAEIVGQGTNVEASIGFRPSNLPKGGLGTWVLGVNNNSGPINAFSLYAANGLGAGMQAITVLPSGNVGIGVPSPEQQLHIAGNLRLPHSTNVSGVIFSGTTRMIHAFGEHNFFAGLGAGNLTMLGIQNLGLGSNALQNNTTGSYNIAGGYGALSANTSGNNNTAVGNAVMASNLTGSGNTAYGSTSLMSNTTGSSNTAAGTAALWSNTTGNHNVAFGYNALFNIRTVGGNIGQYNTGVGSRALLNTSTSQFNTAVGYEAGDSYDNGYNNVFVGANVDVNAAGLFNVIAIGQATVVGASSTARFGNSATLSYGGWAGWSNVSDQRFKRNVKENVPGVEFIKRLRPVTYTFDAASMDEYLYRNDAESATAALNEVHRQAVKEKERVVYTGFVAQEVEAAAREVGFDFSGVDGPQNENDYYSLRYAEFVVPLVKAVQEQQRMIDELKREIQELKRGK